MARGGALCDERAAPPVSGVIPSPVSLPSVIPSHLGRVFQKFPISLQLMGGTDCF